MKKLSLIVLMLAITTTTFAGNFRIGLQADPFFAWIKPDGDEPLKQDGIKIGFTYGLITEYKFGENYSLVTGVNVESLGGKLVFNDSITLLESDTNFVQVSTQRLYKLKYLTIPIAIKMTTKEIGPFKYYGQFGLDIGLRINPRANDKYTGIGDDAIKVQTENNNQEIDGEITLFRTALVVGLGIEYTISGNTALVGGVKFSNGFSNLFPNKIDGVEYLIDGKKPKAYSKAMIITLGVMF